MRPPHTRSRTARRRWWLALALATLPVGGGVHAQELLPLYGGDVRSVVFDPSDPQRAFAGTASGQIYRSDDGGRSWSAPGREIVFPGWVVGTLVFDSSSPARLWAGLWGLWGGGGVAVSDDGGASWSWRVSQELGLEPVYALAISRQEPGTLFAGTRRGVWRSRDEGFHWQKVSFGVEGLEQVSSLALDPNHPRRIVAGTWRRAFRSDDDGETWSGVFDGMVLDTEVFRLLPVAGEPGRLWAATCGWIYRGDGFGSSWSRIREGLTERRTPAFDVLSSRRLLAGTVGGIFLSDDGGASFRPSATPALSIHALAHHPAVPERVLAATEGGGVWRSEDGGASFHPSATGIGALRVAALARTGGRLWAALAWSGPIGSLQSSSDDGVSFREEMPPPGGVLDMAGRDGQLYALTDRGLFVGDGSEWRQVGRPAGAAEPLTVLDATGPGLVVASTRSRYRLENGRLMEIARGEAEAVARLARPALLATGDAGWPHLDARDGVLRLRDAAGRASIEIATDLPAGSVRAVALLGERLLLGTSGYGLRAVRIDAASLREAALQSRSSDATMRR